MSVGPGTSPDGTRQNRSTGREVMATAPLRLAASWCARPTRGSCGRMPPPPAISGDFPRWSSPHAGLRPAGRGERTRERRKSFEARGAVPSKQMSSDDNSCGSEDGEECTELPVTFFVIFSWMVGGLFVNWFLLIVCGAPKLMKPVTETIECTGIVRRGSDCDRCQRGLCCIFAKVMIALFLCACLGPLPLAILLCWYLWRYPCRFCIDLPRQAARRKTQRFSDQKSWKARGWLIMMRARRQRSSARPKGWRTRFRKLEHYDEANIIKNAMKDFVDGQAPPEIELLEAGRLKMNFVRVVMAVVEIPEEGLFRHIITYL
ncbi:unnamed protein product [Ectocarpus sp. 12 AP-2014]